MAEKISLAPGKCFAHSADMQTPHDIINFIGRPAVAERLGITDDAIRLALRSGKLPAHWYHALEVMAGRPLPRDCFTFKGVTA
jgi:hypothetical protein